MSLYHFHVTQIKRSAGQSAIACAAYRAGEKLHSEYYGEDSDYIQAHVLTHPLVYGWQIADAPTDNKQLIRTLREEMMWQCYETYRETSWFADLISQLDDME